MERGFKTHPDGRVGRRLCNLYSKESYDYQLQA